MATCDRCAQLEKERDEAYGYLARLFAFCAPQCKPLPSLPGLATQIDNYIAGLHKKQRPVSEKTPDVKRLIRGFHRSYCREPDEDCDMEDALEAFLERCTGSLLQSVAARTSERDQARAALEMLDTAYCEVSTALQAAEARARGLREALYGLWQAIITRPSLAFVDPPLHAAIARACNALGVTDHLAAAPEAEGATPAEKVETMCERGREAAKRLMNAIASEGATPAEGEKP